MPFKNLPSYLKPRERAFKYGLDKLNDLELLAIILRTGTKNLDVLELAKQILSKYHNFKQLLSLPLVELGKIHGIGQIRALELKTIYEINRRFNNHLFAKIDSLTKVINLAWTQFLNWQQEFFVVILLSKQNNLLYCETLYKSSANSIIIQPKDIITLILQRNAPKFYCLHNHPSGNAKPSEADLFFTTKLRYLAKLMNLTLVEHIIICEDKSFEVIT